MNLLPETTPDAHIAPNQYGPVAPVYDALMQGVPHGAWLSRMERAAREREKFPRAVLDVACGTGIGTLLLARRGYAPVVGVDISPAMIAIARTKAAASQTTAERDVTFHVADVAEWTPDEMLPPFEMIVSLFDSLNYILEPERLQAAFRNLYARAAPGAVFLFDMNSLFALSTGMFTQKCDTGPVQHDWRAHWDRERRQCRVEMDFWVDDGVNDDAINKKRHFTETHIQRAYTVPEVTEWLQASGWGKIDCFGNYGERPPTARSDRLLFVCER